MPTSEKNPSVLVFLHSFEPGGVERVALRLVARWQESGQPISLFMGRMDGAMRGQFADTIHILRAPKTRLPIRHFETLWMIVQLARHIAQMRPQVLFAAGNSYAVVAVAMKWLLGRRCPPIVMKISNDLIRPDMIAPYAFLYRLWLRIQGRAIDRLIAMSEPLAAQIAREMRVSPNRIEIIANPSLDAAYQESGIEARAMTSERSFCITGRLTRQKNLDLALRAFASGAHETDTLTLYGDGPERARLEKLARRLGMGTRVHFAGFVPDARAQMRKHHVLLLTSHYEGLPSVMVEALDAGLHVVTTDCCCSMRWLLDDGQLGAIVSPGEERQLAQAIAQAPAGQQDMARAHAKAALHCIEPVAQDYLRTFKRATRTKAAAGSATPHEMQPITGYVQ